jgi:hypothetical protein
MVSTSLLIPLEYPTRLLLLLLPLMPLTFLDQIPVSLPITILPAFFTVRIRL